MAVSKKQLKANRRNAKRSTGPKTKQGKAVASRNAITHGLATAGVVIDSPHLKEDARQYDQLLKSLFEELQPEGVLQQHLVVKIANCLWRYRRLINAETARINNQLDSAADSHRLLSRLNSDSDDSDNSECDPDQSPRPADMIAARSIPTGTFCINLMHYEMRLDKQLSRAYKLLFHLQLLAASKKGAAAPEGHDVTAIPPKKLPTHHSPTNNPPNEPISPQPIDP